MDAGDFKNTPVEVTESRYPIKVRRYALSQDSGGAGRRRGGLSVIKEYEPLLDGCHISTNIGRTVTPSWGLRGGRAGAIPTAVLSADEQEHSVLVSGEVPFPRGAVLRVTTGGGGGYGRPWERALADVVSDVADGYVSRENARTVYGVVVRDGTHEIDSEGTKHARERLAADEAEA
jgi:N-methylhydantoinase B